MTKKWIINVQEIHTADYVVEADTEEEAREKFHKGLAEYVDDSAQFVETAPGTAVIAEYVEGA